MATSPELKAAAQDERDSLKRVRAAADLAIAGVAALAFLAVAPVGAVALVPAVIRWRISKELTVQERLVEDPPRYDFERPAVPEFERVFLDYSEAARPVSEYVEASVEACALEEAMIQSVEKALGAQERGESRYARERSEEAGGFAIRTATAFALTAERQERLRTEPEGAQFVDAERALLDATIPSRRLRCWRYSLRTCARLHRSTP